MDTSNFKPLIIIAIIFVAVHFVSCSKDKSDDVSNEIELVVASKQQIIENKNTLIVRRLTVNNGWFPYYGEIKVLTSRTELDEQRNMKAPDNTLLNRI